MELIYPLVEYFESIQGEGPYTGFPMLFLRLAGCNVGQYSDPQMQTVLKLHPNHSICQTALGEKFLCDTDYRNGRKTDIGPILEATRLMHVCITGGEPFLYDLLPIVLHAKELGKFVHIETSGTIPIPEKVASDAFIVCSPKRGYLRENSKYVCHFKFVVSHKDVELGATRLWKAIEDVIGELEGASVSLQPVNGIVSVDKELALKLFYVLRDSPPWMDAQLSLQIHKLIGLP